MSTTLAQLNRAIDKGRAKQIDPATLTDPSAIIRWIEWRINRASRATLGTITLMRGDKLECLSLRGAHAYHTNQYGTRVHHPNAYKRKARSARLTYHCAEIDATFSVPASVIDYFFMPCRQKAFTCSSHPEIQVLTVPRWTWPKFGGVG